MNETDATTAFAAFREAVFDDAALLRDLRLPQARDAYVARVVSVGAANGFVFDEAAVRAALREGEQAWLASGADIV